MSLLDYLIPFIGALAILIVIHELGHFLVARWCGVKVLRFSLGFGKVLASVRAGRDGTEWTISAFPLGGYVKMLDEREGEVAEHELPRAFNRQPVGKRFAIVAAGPLANLLLAVVLYWGLFSTGSEELRPRIAAPAAASPAMSAGLIAGDSIELVDGDAVRSWQELRWLLLKHAIDGETVMLGVRSEGSQTLAERPISLSGLSIDEAGEDLVKQIGMAPYRPPIPAEIGRVADDSPAALAGIRSGDRVLAIDDRPVSDWVDLVRMVRDSEGRSLAFLLDRAGERMLVDVVPRTEEVDGQQVARIGVAVRDRPELREAMFVTVRYGALEGLWKAVRQTWETSVLSVSVIGKMIFGDVSWKNISGPVTIADYAGQSAQLGLSHYLKFLALISISLGVLNLLPIPILDGGHLLYYMIEIIKGGPIPERIMEIGQQVGMAVLLMLMGFAFYNDINRLISG
ncbi:MAG: RIP metalloprotease RseP [Rhodocyclaceae bacterium]|nr:RIP metalloprotease RseP [Rhodocyclaceae bacterium]MCP5239003.1 RIP metalloprotease RseP [Zoogloeaceae bacterium]